MDLTGRHLATFALAIGVVLIVAGAATLAAVLAGPGVATAVGLLTGGALLAILGLLVVNVDQKPGGGGHR